MTGETYPHCKVVEVSDVKPGWFVCGSDCANYGTPEEVWYELWRPPIGCTSDEQMVRVKSASAHDFNSVVAKSMAIGIPQMKQLQAGK